MTHGDHVEDQLGHLDAREPRQRPLGGGGGAGRAGYKFRPGSDRGAEPTMRDLVRFLTGLAADLLRGEAALVAENGCFDSSSSWPSEGSSALSGGHRGSAYRWAWPRASRRGMAFGHPARPTGDCPPVAPCRVPCFLAAALAARRSARPRAPRVSFARWRRAIRAGAPSAFAASCSSSASAWRNGRSSGTCATRGHGATVSVGRRFCAITSPGRATSSRPT